MLHFGLPQDSNHKVFKHCTKTYVETGLGNLVCTSHKLSKIEQNLVKIWAIWTFNINVMLFMKGNNSHFC